MDAHKIAIAASEIKKAQAALAWMDSYAANMSPVFDTNGQASSCTGHGEAKGYLTGALRSHVTEVVSLAIQTAEADIAAAKKVIAAEVVK